MSNIIDFPEDHIGDLDEHQMIFDGLMGIYNQGIEPLESWDTDDLSGLYHAIGVELRERMGTGDVNGNR